MKQRNRLPDIPLELWRQQLDNGLAQLQLTLDAAQRGTLLDYLALLHKWNAVYNLSAVRDPREMVSRQLLDSLAVVPWMRGPRILDVGTGAGLPGIPLAIALPQQRLLLLDANGKKTRFVQQALGELRLPNLQVTQARAEDFRDRAGFHTIVSRAFADIHSMLSLTSHLRAPGGQWAAMKAGIDELRPQRLPKACGYRVVELQVPGEAAARRLVLVAETGDGDRIGSP